MRGLALRERLEGMDRELTSWEFSEGDEIAPGRHAVRLLGGGKRYEAYLAWDDLLYSLVVVKVLRPDRADDPVTLDGLAEEASALDRLRHPVLVRAFDAVLTGPRPHLVLEFLEGPRVSTLLRKYGPLAMEQVLPLALQLCSALHYMHARGVVHLDVKPRNIIMGAPPRLIDLSIAKTFKGAGRVTSPIGTDAYMSPEQCDPQGPVPIGPAADMWGLGATLFEAITASHPFAPDPAENGARERFPQLSGDPDPFPAAFPEVLTGPIMACLAREPAERPTAADLARALEPLADVIRRGPVLSRLRPR
jgi:eukaryotic-like serine/threonine-protein kinase